MFHRLWPVPKFRDDSCVGFYGRKIKIKSYSRLPLFHIGVSIGKSEYTCPILAVHTWHKTQQNVRTETGVLHTVGIQGGYSSNTNRNATMLRAAGDKVEFKVGVDEEIQIIPVEDIISIKIATEVKKAVEQKKTARQKSRPAEELSGCEKVKKCCMTNVFCCCCKEEVQAPDYEITMTEKEEATRIITVIIQHVGHSLVHTPSVVRVLPSDKQAEFYQKYQQVNTLKFYYLHNETFDENEYKMNLQDSEALARIVMQLKAMGNCNTDELQLRALVSHFPDESQLKAIVNRHLDESHVTATVNRYPDEAQLKQMIQQNCSHRFGQMLMENIPILEHMRQVTSTTTHINPQLRLTTS